MDYSSGVQSGLATTDEIKSLAALMKEGGEELFLCTIFMELTDFGWALWEDELYELNVKHRLQEALPSWITSTLRHQLRTELVLCNYHMGPRHGQLIGQALNHGTRLQRLVLQHNPIGDEGTEAIAKALYENKNLDTLHLVGARIGTEGVKHLAAALKHNRSLQFLHLGLNEIDDEGIAILADGLRDNHVLGEVLLENNPFGNDKPLQDAGLVHSGRDVYIRSITGSAKHVPRVARKFNVIVRYDEEDTGTKKQQGTSHSTWTEDRQDRLDESSKRQTPKQIAKKRKDQKKKSILETWFS